MAEHPTTNEPPYQAGPVRRAFHTLIAVAGWVLFVWWWWLVFRRVSHQEIRFTLLFVSISLVVIVAITASWALHNIRIFRHRGPRLLARDVAPEPGHDSVGRELRLPVVADACRSASIVSVRIEGSTKVYLAIAPAKSPGGGPTS